LAELQKSGEVVAEPTGEHTAVYLKRLYDAEVTVAERIHQLTQGRPIGRSVIDRAVAAAERAVQITLSQEQRSALRCAMQSKVTVITGGPGTGKTTLLKSVIAALADAGLKPTLAAPTGRAARRLQEATGRESKTIHRLLEYTPETQGCLRNADTQTT